MKNIFGLLLICFFFASLSAQSPLLNPRFQFDPDLKYDAGITSPSDYLGYELGEAFTVYAHIEHYIKMMAESSPRIVLREYGETYERRKLYSLVISSEKNIQNLEKIRSSNLAIIEGGAADIKSSELPVFVSFSYNIHGNEASSSEAVMQVLYRLAASNDMATQELLDNAIIIMYPCINPDGRDRYVYWYNSVQRDIVGHEPSDLEHDAPWPNGRTNHYWFDLNRDWIWGVHPESRGHSKEYQHWMPHLHTDYHEMGYNSNYFTMPGTTPRNKLLPDDYESLSDTIGRANIAAFDEHKINYFTREAFDFFYPGYGSSYPSVMGAIGMLVEQGGIAGGTSIETNDGYHLTLRQRIFDHYETTLATIAKAVERKDEFIKYSHDSFNPATSKTKTKSYIIDNDGSPYLTEVIRILDHNGIKVDVSDDAFTSTGINFKNGKSQKQSFHKGSYIISTNQNRHLLINTLFSRQMEIEDSVMYDMATWSVPLAYNLNCQATQSTLSVASTSLTSLPKETAALENKDAKYAYSIDWKQRYAPKALSMLWEKGYKVRSAEKSFNNGSENFDQGTLIILIGRNYEKKDVIASDMQSIAEKAGVSIQGHDTGRMEEGIDLASNKSRPVKKPKAAMLVEGPFSTYTAGQIYWLFDQETTLPLVRIRTNKLSQTSLPKFGSRYGYADLNKYNVLILPGGGNHLGKVWDKEGQKVLADWIKGGGTLIATESAAEFFTKKNSKITNVELAKLSKDSSVLAKYVSHSEHEHFHGVKRIPGTAMSAHIDNTNPLAFGLPDHLYSLKFGNKSLKAALGFEAVGYYNKDASQLLVSGYSSEENLNMLAGNVFAGVKKLGKGKIVYLLDNTQYRMFWRGPSRMMQNAVMLLPGF